MAEKAAAADNTPSTPVTPPTPAGVAPTPATPRPIPPLPDTPETPKQAVAEQKVAIAEDSAAVAAAAVAQAEKDAKTALTAVEKSFVCPHCGVQLRPHGDASRSLHCPGVQCNDCCFLPPDDSSDGAVREKMEARYCALRVVPFA